MEGWIKLHRKILDNPVVCKDSDHIAVWLYLLLNATHKEQPVLFQGKKIMLQPGQLITGRKVISSELKVDESKVTRILKTLENEQQIEQQTSNKNRIITILNWHKYQNDEQQTEQQVNNKRTTTEQQVNTNKNVKNEKNVENEKKKELNHSSRQPKTYAEDSTPYRMAVYLHNKLMQYAESISKAHLVRDADLQKWADSCRKILEIDKREKAEVFQVIEWATANTFWQGNILSPDSLRKQYVKLCLEMGKEQRNGILGNHDQRKAEENQRASEYAHLDKSTWEPS